jgi:hypothetical protein
MPAVVLFNRALAGAGASFDCEGVERLIRACIALEAAR